MKVKVISATEYTRKKDNTKIWRITAIDDAGQVVVFFRPYEEAPKPGSLYEAVLRYNAFKFAYAVGFEPA